MLSEEVKDEDRPIEMWPDKDLLKTALRKWLGDPKIRVTEFTSRIATNKGDNYTSDMFRVIATCEHKKDPLTIIIKRLISTGSSGELMMNSTLFVREEQMLNTILPEMYAVLKKVVPDVEPFGAEFIYATPGVLMMEDLRQGGFRMAQRRLGLDLNHCSLVLRTLARYHAAGVFLLERKSTDFSVFQKSFFSEPQSKEDMTTIFSGMMKTLSEEVESFDGLGKYSAKVSALADGNFLSLLQKALEDNQDGDLLMISHGDLWVNNMLFRYSSSEKPDGFRFVDLQLACITSPCIDLHYFLTSSSNETVRTTCIDQLLVDYHQTLCRTMIALDCSTKPPTFEKLREEYDRKIHHSMFAAFIILPLVLAEPGQFDFGTVMDTGKAQNDLFRSKAYRSALEWYLPIFENKGCL